MTHHESEPWWTQRDSDAAWIDRQEAISTATLSAPAPAAAACRTGKLADAIGRAFSLQVCQSVAGYYIGTLDEHGLPCSRERIEYWRKAEAAQHALDYGRWTQKPNP